MIELIKWDQSLRTELIRICNSVDRSNLSDRMPMPYTEADAAWWLGYVGEHDGIDALFRAIVLDGRIIGSISIEPMSDVYRIDSELGYFLVDECRGQGIMTEAAARICRMAFEQLDIVRITSKVYAGNAASRRVLEKNGFVMEGMQRNAVLKDGKLRDLYIFGKMKDDGPVVSVDLMRRSDAYTIRYLVPGRELMYRASYGVYRSYDGWRNKRIAILCGGGNNGGDGYALAGILKKEGIASVIFRVSDRMSEDGRYFCDIAEELGVEIRAFDENTEFDGFDVIVDCMLGTGFSGTVRGITRKAIEAVNNSGAYVISVDINSGMNGDTGEAELAVKSDLTVSVGYYKQGLFKGDADRYISNLTNVDIGIVLLEE